VSTSDDDAVAAGHSVDPARWRVLFDELMFLVAGRFGRVGPRRTARDMVLGLLSPAERKNCWWLAEQVVPADRGHPVRNMRGRAGKPAAHRSRPTARRAASGVQAGRA
jgi:hypothetical protein